MQIEYFGKILFPEVWVKILPANEIEGFLNQLYLQNRFLHDFFAYWYKLTKIKSWNFFGLVWWIKAVASLVMGL